jgi:hypothetical protein
MAKIKVLITVKTYPAISTKYEELVCTAGFREDGTWIRIYPVQYRKKAYNEQYGKYQWIEMDLVKNDSDFRFESYRPISHDTEIKILNEIPPDGDDWNERRKVVLNKIYYSLAELIAEAKDRNTGTSLAVFKPTKVIDFVWEEVEREWDEKKLAVLRQCNLFDSANEEKSEVVRKLPYKFSFIFEDIQGQKSTLMIEDWETGALYWKMMKKHNNEKRACEAVRAKYFDDFAKTKDLHFYLGTSQTFHLVAPNPFMIIGTFHPNKITQPKLDL